ncbi:hypothetical protein BDD21_0866 [Thiocapsa rosea]|uniref:Uncharacterized protein n=1 Tax=Thiocapsa rosea TaxID=69360 RepID=A0A495V2I7_9GAMM|nr:hypothetical protein BDD21_0866 [Thiocapsa rosea]
MVRPRRGRAGPSPSTDRDRDLFMKASTPADEATDGRVPKGVQHVLRCRFGEESSVLGTSPFVSFGKVRIERVGGLLNALGVL